MLLIVFPPPAISPHAIPCFSLSLWFCGGQFNLRLIMQRCVGSFVISGFNNPGIYMFFFFSLSFSSSIWLSPVINLGILVPHAKRFLHFVFEKDRFYFQKKKWALTWKIWMIIKCCLNWLLQYVLSATIWIWRQTGVICSRWDKFVCSLAINFMRGWSTLDCINTGRLYNGLQPVMHS